MRPGGELAVREWRFDDPPNLAVITTRQVLDGREAVLSVSHDADDSGWQFLGQTVDEADAAVVGLAEIVALAPSVTALHDLPLGWRAWRSNPRSPWRRERS
jgi:hypothetical protein